MTTDDTRDRLSSTWIALDYSAREMLDGALHVSRAFTFVFAIEELHRLSRLAVTTSPALSQALAVFEAAVPMTDGRIAGRDDVVGKKYWGISHRDGDLVLDIGSVSIPVLDVRAAAGRLYKELKKSHLG